MTKTTGLAKSYGAAVGENLARIRESRRQTQREAAGFLREHDLEWSAGKIAQIESGRRESIRLDELVLLSNAYEVPLTEWFEGDGSIYLTDDSRIARTNLRYALAGGEISLMHKGLRQRTYAYTDVDRAAALALNTTQEWIREISEHLYKRSLAEERDARIGDIGDLSARSLQAKRGRVTRVLIEEIAAEMSGR